MIKDTLIGVVFSSAMGMVYAIGTYSSTFADDLTQYVNKQAIQEKVAQFERGESQSETMWDYIQGKEDVALAGSVGGLVGLVVGYMYYRAGQTQQNRRKYNLQS